MSEENKTETNQSSQSEGTKGADESKSSMTFGEMVSGAIKSDSSEASEADQGKSEVSESKEEANAESSEDNSSESSQSKAESDQEKDIVDNNSESEDSKLRESYKSLEREFHKRNQLSKEREKQLSEQAEMIKELQNQIKQINGEDKEASIIDTIREKGNLEAAETLAQLKEEAKKEAVREIRKQFEEELQSLKKDSSERKAEENVAIFEKKFNEFRNGPLGSLEQKFLDFVGNEYPTDERFLKDAQSNGKLYDNLYQRFVADNLDEVIQVKLEKQQDKKETKAQTKTKQKDVDRAKGVAKPNTSSPEDAEEDLGDLNDPKNFTKQLKKHPKKVKEWAMKNKFNKSTTMSDIFG